MSQNNAVDDGLVVGLAALAVEPPPAGPPPNWWAGYFGSLLCRLPPTNQLVAALGQVPHPAASMNESLGHVLGGGLRGPSGDAFHLAAVTGLRQMTDLELVDLVVRLDLSAQFYKCGWGRDHAALDFERVAVRREWDHVSVLSEAQQMKLDRISDMKDIYEREFHRFGIAIELGETVEDLVAERQKLISHLHASLESHMAAYHDEFHTLSGFSIPGDMQQFLAHFQSIRQLGQRDSQNAGADTLDPDEVLEFTTKRLVAAEVELAAAKAIHIAEVNELEVEIEDLHDLLERPSEIRDLEDENTELRKQIAELKKRLQEKSDEDEIHGEGSHRGDDTRDEDHGVEDHGDNHHGAENHGDEDHGDHEDHGDNEVHGDHEDHGDNEVHEDHEDEVEDHGNDSHEDGNHGDDSHEDENHGDENQIDNHPWRQPSWSWPS